MNEPVVPRTPWWKPDQGFWHESKSITNKMVYKVFNYLLFFALVFLGVQSVMEGFQLPVVLREDEIAMGAVALVGAFLVAKKKKLFS